MNKIQDLYFALLRAAIYQTECPAIPELNEKDWAALIRLALRQGTGPLVFDLMLMHDCPGLTREMTEFIKGTTAHTMLLQEQQRRVMRQASEALRAGEIEPVLMKGLTLARRYPKPYLRASGDVDLFVGKGNYHLGAKILRETFPDAPRFDTEEEYFRHYNINVGPVPVEMHRVSRSFAHPRDAKYYDKLEALGLDGQRVLVHDGEDTYYEPEAKFNVLFVFLHSWEHFVTETPSLRQLTDLALLLRQNSEAELTNYLKKNLSRLHVKDAWQLYAYILVHYLRLPEDKCPLYTARVKDRAELLLQQILFGERPQKQDKGNAPKNVILRKLYTFITRTRDAREIAKYCPSYARHMVITDIAQSWDRFLKGQNTRHWE